MLFIFNSDQNNFRKDIKSSRHAPDEGRILRLQKASYLAAGSAVVLMNRLRWGPPGPMPVKCIGFESLLTDIDCSYIAIIMLYENDRTCTKNSGSPMFYL